MAGIQPYHWAQQHNVNSLCFDLGTDSMEHNLRELQQQQAKGFENKFPQPHAPLYPSSPPFTSRPDKPRLPEGDQVVPSFQRLTVYERGQPYVPCRDPKPLPPLPDPEALSSDEAADEEVEFFTDDRLRLLPKRCPKTFALRYGAPGRRSFRGCGQVNYAYHEGHAGAGSGGASCATSSWASNGATSWASSGAKSVVSMDSGEWTSSAAKVGTGGGVQGPWSQRQQGEQVLAAVRDTPLGKQPDRPQRSKLRRSHSERRTASHHHNHHHHPQGACRDNGQDKPEVPPRAPIPPRPLKTSTAAATADWSARSDDKDKPPKVPPRVPLRACVPPRTPSPKSLPIYVNGVMPPTQSFAPNPKYVSKAPQRAPPPQSERPSSPDTRTPCIVPVMEDGRKASATHYFLLPRRPPYMDRLERFLREADCEAASGACCSDWGCHNGQKPPLQLM